MTYLEIKQKFENERCTDEGVKTLLEERINELESMIDEREIELSRIEKKIEELDVIYASCTPPIDGIRNELDYLLEEKKNCKEFLDDIAFKIEKADLKELSKKLDIALKENDRKYIDVLKTRICKAIDNKIDELKNTKERIEKL